MYNFRGAMQSGLGVFRFSVIPMIIRFSDPEFIHYTLHPGTASGILDIHKTNEQLPSADPKRHETVVVIPKAAIE